jgi:hypothetical protein
MNLVHRRVEVYSDLGSEGYQSRQEFVAGQEVPLVVGGVEIGRIAVAAILP